MDKLTAVLTNPRQFKIPTWFLNRQKDTKDGKYFQITSNNLDSKLRDDLEYLKKMRLHRGLRHYWGLKVRGQHTKTTGIDTCCWHSFFDIDIDMVIANNYLCS